MTTMLIDVDAIREAFGYTEDEMAGLLPLPGECLDLHTCHELALPGKDKCAKHNGGAR